MVLYGPFAGTPGSMNSLSSDLFRDLLGDFRGRSGLFREDLGRFLMEN